MDAEQFEKYQYFTENTINSLSQQVMALEKKLDTVSSILEMSKYVNQYIKDPNLFLFINDMLIGIFGAKYSAIYRKLNGRYLEVASKNTPAYLSDMDEQLILDHKEEEFIINSDVPIYPGQSEKDGIYSCLGVPIAVDKCLLGFIVIQHSEKEYFTKDHALFLASLSNHIGVAIENNLLYNQIKEIAYQDGLTGIFNKRYFFEAVEEKLNLYHKSYGIVMVDLDDFKYINDTYGHPFGDVVLKQVAQIIKLEVLADDILARYGGEEFIIFLAVRPDKEELYKWADTVREQIAMTRIENEGIVSGITASFGIYYKAEEELSLGEVIKRADNNLYASKRKGKNKVTIN